MCIRDRELTANLIEKYNEQLLHGKSEEEAYNAVITGLGDLSELVDSVRPHSTKGPSEQERKKSALLTAAAVMMYILSPVMIILFESIGLEILGLVLFFGCIAGATGMLIYNHMTRPVYEKQDENIVCLLYTSAMVEDTGAPTIVAHLTASGAAPALSLIHI